MKYQNILILTGELIGNPILNIKGDNKDVFIKVNLTPFNDSVLSNIANINLTGRNAEIALNYAKDGCNVCLTGHVDFDKKIGITIDAVSFVSSQHLNLENNEN